MNRQLMGTLALTLSLVGVGASQAQMPGYSMPAGPGAAYANYGPAVHPAGGPGPMPGSAVQQAQCTTCGPGGAMSGGPWMSEPMQMAGPDGCGSMCGPAGGCDGCGPGGGLGLGGLGAGLGCMGDHLAGGYGGFNSQHFGQEHGPYGSGGCCVPRWFDFSAEWLYWKRDGEDSLRLSSQGIAGPTVLDTNQLDFHEQSGFKVTGAYLIASATALEATYFGTANWSDSAEVTSVNDDLFSALGDFGTNTFNAFPETGQSNFHSVAISTELDNAELNLRHRWVSANCLIHSSWMIGARYLRLRDDMTYITRTNTQAIQGDMDYQIKADNDLVGAQIGTDAFICITPRFKIGAEVEAGVYGNSSKQRTWIDCTSCPEPIVEMVRDTEVAFVGEAGAMGLYRLTPHTTLRGGYQVLFLDGVALAADNFNSTTPVPGRSPVLNNSGNLLFHGVNLGFEYTW